MPARNPLVLGEPRQDFFIAILKHFDGHAGPLRHEPQASRIDRARKRDSSVSGPIRRAPCSEDCENRDANAGAAGFVSHDRSEIPLNSRYLNQKRPSLPLVQRKKRRFLRQMPDMSESKDRIVSAPHELDRATLDTTSSAITNTRVSAYCQSRSTRRLFDRGQFSSGVTNVSGARRWRTCGGEFRLSPNCVPSRRTTL